MQRKTSAVLFVAVLVSVLGALSYDSYSAQNTATTPSSGDQKYWVEEVSRDLNLPWGMTFLPNGDMLVTERIGKIKVLRLGDVIAELKGVPDVLRAIGWDGLFDVVLDPDFKDNQFVYLTYVSGTADHRLAQVFKAKLVDNQLVDGKVIYTVDPPLPEGGPAIYHVLFLPDKTMLVSIASGNQTKAPMVQRTDNLAGKIIRLNRDGSIPKDNPFVGNPAYKPEIWAMGFRNVSGMTQTSDGRLWGLDIGPKGGDELNELKPGGNYGWPLVTWGFDYTGIAMSQRQTGGNDFIDPILVWVPSQTPAGLMQYTGKTYPDWNGDLFTGGLSSGAVRRIRLRNGEVVLQERMFTELNERFRTVRVGPDGMIYLLTESRDGRLLRLRPGSPTPEQLARVAKRSGESARPTQNRLSADTERQRSYAHRPDADRGRELFAQNCASCHTFREFNSGHIGPDLNGVMGRRSGTLPNYDYSPILRDPKSQVVWRSDSLRGLLQAPQLVFPGTKMNVVIDRQEDRVDIAAYLLRP
ncbi:MAG: PQQ-dependent sugar dehydrogenase [Candidatus Korobacteraceae bacterium]